MARRRGRTVFAFLAAITGLVALGLFPQEPLRRLVEARLRASLGPSSRIGRLHVVPGTLRAEIEDLLLESPTWRLEAPRVRLALSPETLLGRAVSLRVVELDAPRLFLKASTEPAASAAFDRPISIRGIAVNGATVVYDDASLRGQVSLHGVDLSGGIGAGALEISVAGGLWQHDPRVTLGPARGRLRISPLLALEIESFEAGTLASRLQVWGSLGRAGSLSPDLTLTAHLDLADPAAPHALPPDTAGLILADAKLAGLGSTLTLSGSLQGADLRVSGWPVDHLDGRFTHDASGPGVSTAELDLHILGGRAKAEARLAGQQSNTRLSLSTIDLARLSRRLAPGQSPLQGTLGGDLTARGDLGGPLDSHLTITGVVEASPGTAVRVRGEATGQARPSDRSVDLDWTLEIQADGSGVLRSGTLVTKGTAEGPLPPQLHADIQGVLSLDPPAGPLEVPLSGALQSRGGEVMATLQARGLGGSLDASVESDGPLVRRLAIEGKSLGIHGLVPGASGDAHFSFEASGPVDQLALSARGGIEELAWQNVKVGTLSMSAEGTSASAHLQVQAPELHIEGQGDLRSGKPADLRGTLTLASTPLGPISPLVPEGFAIEGAISGTIDVAAPLAHLDAAVVQAHLNAAHVTSGRWSATAMRPFDVTAEGKRLTLRGLALEGPGVSLEADGSFGLAGSDLLELRAAANLDLGGLPAFAGWTLAGRAAANVDLAGTLQNPRATGIITGDALRFSSAGGPPLEVDELRIQLDGAAAAFDGITGRVAGGLLTASGRIPLAAVVTAARSRPGFIAPTEEARLHGTWTGIEAAQLLAGRAAEGSAGIDATLTGEVDVEGGLASVSEIRARLTTPTTAVRVQELSLEVSPLALRLENGRFSSGDVTVTSDAGSFHLEGTADLSARTLDASGKGVVDLRALSPFLSGAAVSGPASVDIAVSGPFDAPRPRGTLRLSDGSLRIRDIPQALTSVALSLSLDGEEARIEEGSALFGGGPLTLSGGVRLEGGHLSQVAVKIKGEDLSLRYPVGLSSRLNADLSLDGRAGAMRLSGSVKAQRGTYDLDVALEDSLLASVVKPVESPLMRGIALDVQTRTENPVVVRSDRADLRATGAISLRGDLETPAPFGRLDIEPGGKFQFQGREFRVNNGSLEYAGTWFPSLSFQARTVIPNVNTTTYEVTLFAEGPLEKPRLRFSSDPPLASEGEVLGLVATGTLGADPLRSGRYVAGEQAATLLAGRLTRGVARELKHIGIDQVTIQPELLARDTDPGARFTFGKDLTPWAGLLYSLSLNNPEDRFIRLTTRPGRDVAVMGQRQEDGTITYGAGQSFRLGGAARGKGFTEEKVRLQDVRLDGAPPLREAALRRIPKARAGHKASAWSLQDDAERLRAALRREGHLEAEVGARLDGETAVFSLRPGPRYRWRVEGMTAPPAIDREIEKALFEEEAIDRARARLLEELRRRGYLRASVHSKAVTDGAERTLVFSVAPGELAPVAEVRFDGAKALGTRSLLAAAGGSAMLVTQPRKALVGMKAAYLERHYRGVQIGVPQVSPAPGGLSIVVPVQEGEPARIVSLRIDGASRSAEELAEVARLAPGSAYDEGHLAEAAQRLREHYYELGYPAVQVVPSLTDAGADVGVVLSVAEGEQVIVGAVTFTGMRRTRESLLRHGLELKPGDPLDPRKLAALERRLLNLGIFSRVNASVSAGSPATVTVEVQEDARAVASYDLRYDDAKKGTVQLDGELKNLFGAGLAVGGRYRQGRDVTEARGSLHMPSFGRGGDLTTTVFRLDEDLGDDNRVQEGFQLQKTFHSARRWDLLYGYRFKRSTFSSPFLINGPVVTDLAGVDTSLIRDTRDSPLDARRGHFLSLSLDVSPALLGSDFNFVKGLAQAFLSRPVRPTLTWAQGYRLGLAHVLNGEPLISDEGFRAGGGNSIRGFATDDVGPRGFRFGNQAVLVINQELRYHHASGVGAVLFYDLGNAFASVRDMNFSLRHAVGAGLRWDSPVGLLRFDVGLPLNRREGDARVRFFFSIGQAF